MSVTSIVWSGGLVQTNQHIPVNLIIKHFLCQKICAVLHLRRLIVRWSVLSPSYAKLNGCVVEVLHLFLDRRSKSTCTVSSCFRAEISKKYLCHMGVSISNSCYRVLYVRRTWALTQSYIHREVNVITGGGERT